MPYAQPKSAKQRQDTNAKSEVFSHGGIKDTSLPAFPTSSGPSRPSPPASTSPGRQLRRIPAPSILPPVVDSTHSTLHLSLPTNTSSSISLKRQVDRLLAQQHDLRPSPPGPRSPAPPPLPPKENRFSAPQRDIPMPEGQRRPLPVPPREQVPHTQPGAGLPYQYPASYGPSISKIRSFSAQPPAVPGLPPGAVGLPRNYYYAQPSSPFPLASIAGGGPPPPLRPPPPPPPTDTISRSFAKGGASIFLHKGFFDLLSLSPQPESEAGQSFGYAGQSEGWMGDRPVKNTLRAVTAPVFASQASGAPQLRQGGKPLNRSNKRISVAMVGRPTGFTHLAHASDAEEAEELLTRWRVDGKGKLAEPAWVTGIKEAARARAQARGIAQIQANLDYEREQATPKPLKVTNANPDSLISIFTDRADHGSHAGESTGPGMPLASPPAALQVQSPFPGTSPIPSPRLGYDDQIIVHEDVPVRPIMPPPNLRANTAQTMIIRNPDALASLQDAEDLEEVPYPIPAGRSAHPVALRPGGPSSPSRQNGEESSASKPFKPSLETVERSVATKIYLENHYYGILKRPRDRDQRRAALERELAAANMSDEQRRTIRAAWMLSETEHLRDIRNRVSANSFAKIKTIGHGAFGVVSLVRERGSGELYAMKQLRKADMLRKGQEGHVRAERDVMSAASSSSVSRWIVRLVYSFQDTDHLYLVMEYMGGGDLLNLLIEKDVFEEGFAKFYVAEMVLAVQEAHKLGYIHRDIKPDNFIFSSDGHIKLSDFGLATDFHWAHDGAYYEQQRRQLLRKHGIDLDESIPLAGGARRYTGTGGLDLGDLPNIDDDEEERAKGVLTWRDKNRKRLAYSVVGTNSYMSPEVIRGTGYDQACDWWSLGIILFECLFGYPPFVSKSRHITRQKILTWRQSLRFPSRPRVSAEAQDLIQRLICEREDRLGSRTAPSTIRANSVVLAQRRSGFLGPAPGFPGLKDGAEDIKAHPWFRGINFQTLHLQAPPFKPDLRDPTDTRYFDDDINDEPLPPPDAQPGHAEATKDPMLRDKVHGKHLLDVRKQLAFQGYTFKSPKQKVFNPRNGLRSIAADIEAAEDARGRSMLREPSSGFRRAMSL